MSASEDATRLARSLAAFADLNLRVSWLRDQLTRMGPTTFAGAVEGVLTMAHSGQADCRQALLACAILLVVDRKSPTLLELSKEAERNAFLGLTRLLPPAHLAPEPDETPADDDRPVSTNGDRELSVGERRALARRPTRRQLERLLADPHPLVLETLFQCPTLTEADVLRVITKRPARLSAVEKLCDTPRWLARHNVRVALIQNPGVPQSIALPLLATCLREDLASVLESTNLSPIVRNAARELLLRLPPLAPGSSVLQ